MLHCLIFYEDQIPCNCINLPYIFSVILITKFVPNIDITGRDSCHHVIVLVPKAQWWQYLSPPSFYNFTGIRQVLCNSIRPVEVIQNGGRDVISFSRHFESNALFFYLNEWSLKNICNTLTTDLFIIKLISSISSHVALLYYELLFICVYHIFLVTPVFQVKIKGCKPSLLLRGACNWIM